MTKYANSVSIWRYVAYIHEKSGKRDDIMRFSLSFFLSATFSVQPTDPTLLHSAAFSFLVDEEK